MMKGILLLFFLLGLSACSKVHEEDLPNPQRQEEVPNPMKPGFRPRGEPVNSPR